MLFKKDLGSIPGKDPACRENSADLGEYKTFMFIAYIHHHFATLLL